MFARSVAASSRPTLKRGFASKASGGSTKNTSGTAGKRLGVKVHHHGYVRKDGIIVRQNGRKMWEGHNVSVGRNYSLHAQHAGFVEFEKISLPKGSRHKRKTVVHVIPLPNGEPTDFADQNHLKKLIDRERRSLLLGLGPKPEKPFPEAFKKRAARGGGGGSGGSGGEKTKISTEELIERASVTPSADVVELKSSLSSNSDLFSALGRL